MSEILEEQTHCRAPEKLVLSAAGRVQSTMVSRSGWPGLWIALLAASDGADDNTSKRFVDDSIRDDDSP